MKTIESLLVEITSFPEWVKGINTPSTNTSFYCYYYTLNELEYFFVFYQLSVSISKSKSLEICENIRINFFPAPQKQFWKQMKWVSRYRGGLAKRTPNPTVLPSSAHLYALIFFKPSLFS